LRTKVVDKSAEAKSRLELEKLRADIKLARMERLLKPLTLLTPLLIAALVLIYFQRPSAESIISSQCMSETEFVSSLSDRSLISLETLLDFPFVCSASQQLVQREIDRLKVIYQDARIMIGVDPETERLVKLGQESSSACKVVSSEKFSKIAVELAGELTRAKNERITAKRNLDKAAEVAESEFKKNGSSFLYSVRLSDKAAKQERLDTIDRAISQIGDGLVRHEKELRGDYAKCE
jgi:hypothetical protein